MGTPSYCLVDSDGKVAATGLDLIELEEKMETLSKAHIVKGGGGMIVG